jgi:predicted PurR-regulated permease PerM
MSPDTRWKIGLVLTIIIILWLVGISALIANGIWQLEELTNQVTSLRKSIQQSKKSTSQVKSRHIVVGYPTEKLDKIYLHVQSIERFVRTTPLVECGEQHEPR